MNEKIMMGQEAKEFETRPDDREFIARHATDAEAARFRHEVEARVKAEEGRKPMIAVCSNEKCFRRSRRSVCAEIGKPCMFCNYSGDPEGGFVREATSPEKVTFEKREREAQERAAKADAEAQKTRDDIQRAFPFGIR